MPPTVSELVDVRSDEVRGRVVKHTRKMKIEDIESTTQNSACSEIYESGILPEAGSAIVINLSILYLINRNIEFRESNDIADVELVYEGGTTSSGAGNVTRSGGDASVSQITTPTDREGNEVSVEFNSIIERVPISVYQPQLSPWLETIEPTTDPLGLARTWLGVTNSAPWGGLAAGMWLITRVRWEELNPHASPPLYRYFWQMQESTEAQGWLPIVAWIDPETNRMPNGLAVGTGIKTVPWYYQRDYNSKFVV